MTFKNTTKSRAIIGLATFGWSVAAIAAPGFGSAQGQNQDEVSVAQPVPPVDASHSLNYDYVHLGWVVNSNLDPDSGGDRDGNGLDIRASHALGKYFFIQGSSVTPDYRDSGNDIAIADWIQTGPGVHLPLLQGNYPLDIWGQVSYNRLGIQGLASTGYGLAGGLRFAPTPRIELNASVRYANTEGNLAGADIDIDPLIYKIEALYFASPRIGLTAGYRGGTYDVDGPGTRQDVDLSQFTVGLRYNYGVESKHLPALPKDAPTPYNYAQISYIVNGEIDPDGAPSIDNDGGFGLEASALLGDNIFVRGTALTVKYDLNGVNTDAALSDMAFIGPGLRYGHALGPVHADLYGQATYDRLAIGGAVADGYGGELGARFLLAPGIELDGWYRAGVAQFGGGNNADPRLYGARLIVSAPNHGRWSQLALVFDYMGGQINFDSPAADMDIKTLAVGLRGTF